MPRARTGAGEKRRIVSESHRVRGEVSATGRRHELFRAASCLPGVGLPGRGGSATRWRHWCRSRSWRCGGQPGYDLRPCTSNLALKRSHRHYGDVGGRRRIRATAVTCLAVRPAPHALSQAGAQCLAGSWGEPSRVLAVRLGYNHGQHFSRSMRAAVRFGLSQFRPYQPLAQVSFIAARASSSVPFIPVKRSPLGPRDMLVTIQAIAFPA